MILYLAGVVLRLILLHGPTGHEINLNIADISSIRRPHGYEEQEHHNKKTKCVVVMSNGNFISTLEECEEVIDKITEVDRD